LPPSRLPSFPLAFPANGYAAALPFQVINAQRFNASEHILTDERQVTRPLSNAISLLPTAQGVFLDETGKNEAPYDLSDAPHALRFQIHP